MKKTVFVLGTSVFFGFVAVALGLLLPFGRAVLGEHSPEQMAYYYVPVFILGFYAAFGLQIGIHLGRSLKAKKQRLSAMLAIICVALCFLPFSINLLYSQESMPAVLVWALVFMEFLFLGAGTMNGAMPA